MDSALRTDSDPTSKIACLRFVNPLKDRQSAQSCSAHRKRKSKSPHGAEAQTGKEEETGSKAFALEKTSQEKEDPTVEEILFRIEGKMSTFGGPKVGTVLAFYFEQMNFNIPLQIVVEPVTRARARAFPCCRASASLAGLSHAPTYQ
jgi:hypothetical protein